jgi:hypothetical protein
MDKKRRQRIVWGVTLAAAAAFSCFLAYEWNWKSQRQQAREWLGIAGNSWYAPSLEGARIQASAPWALRLLGEKGVVAIGMDVEQFRSDVPYSPEVLRNLFPEAAVDYSRNGNFVTAANDP